MTPTLERWLPLLRCPRTGAPLSLDGETVRAASGETYPVVHGKPVLVRRIERLNVEPPPGELVSRNLAEFQPPEAAADARLVHLGCGDVGSGDARVLSIDVLPLPAADIVAEAEALPLADACVDHLTSGATFEHVHDPVTAGAEVRRVLRPGGGFYIDTAFLQTYHGFPSHYFNMTAQAAETCLVGDLDVVHAGASPSGSPAVALGDFVQRLLASLPEATAARLRGLTLETLLRELEPERYAAGPITASLSEHTRRAMAAAVVVIARKPPEYAPFEDETVRRAFYTARTGIIQHHHDAQAFGAGADAGGPDGDLALPDLGATLERVSRLPWPQRAAAAAEEAERMLALRDRWRERWLAR